jgi:Type I phosphodiesterase / nucleotide pyrophosphatase
MPPQGTGALTASSERVLPNYGESTLADLGESLLASLGVPGAVNAVGLASADRACMLVIDGLGWYLLSANLDAAPFLASLLVDGRQLSAGFPSTTVTSLSSLGTGRPPGQHGLLGYQVRVPGTGQLLNGLQWDKAVDPVSWQPGPTVFERAVAGGVGAFRVAQGSFKRTGLSAAAMRGAEYRSANTLGALVAVSVEALATTRRGFVQVYSGDLDSTGHACGCTSPAWRFQLAHVDKLAEQLARALPRGVPLYITADHGMVDVDAADRIDADLIPELRAGVALLGGEPRARHVYAVPGATGDVLAAWQETLGDRAWTVSREQATDEGWFGPVDPGVADRLGDVIAAARGNAAVIASVTEPRESALVGMHGSLSASDQQIPLLSYLAG